MNKKVEETREEPKPRESPPPTGARTIEIRLDLDRNALAFSIIALITPEVINWLTRLLGYPIVYYIVPYIEWHYIVNLGVWISGFFMYKAITQGKKNRDHISRARKQ